MSSRNDHLTERLVIAAKYGNYDAIRPLVDEGASVNGFPTDNDEDIPLLSALYEIIHKVDYVCFGDQSKRNYALTFRALFECGADIEVIKDFDWLDVISDVFEPNVVVLFLKYGARYSRTMKITPNSVCSLSFHRTICYNFGRCFAATYNSMILCVISFGLAKEFFILVNDDFLTETVRYDLKKRLLELPDTSKLIVEFVFAIDFVIETF